MSYETALLSQEIDFSLASKLARDLGDMSERAAVMVERAVEAFDASDAEAAEKVFAMDDEVDRLFDTIREEVVRTLRDGSEPAAIAPELLTIAKYYERAGDHAQSIADWAIFRATGSYRGRSMGEGH